MSATYFGILTKYGEEREAQAHALGVPLKITSLSVGDGGGVVPIPNRLQTAVVGEWRRKPLNQLSTDPANPTWLIAEQVIPENEGGNWIRTLGLHDETGALVAVANCPPTYKPLLAEGSGRTQVIRMVLMVSSAENFELKIDPAVVLATRKYVDDLLALKLDKTGTAVAAAKLATARTLALTGDGTASVAFDGSKNVSAALTLAASGVTAGTAGSANEIPIVTVDAKGRVITLGTVAVGNAATATKLAAARLFSITGGATAGGASFDGSGNLSLTVTALDVSKATAGILPVARGGSGLGTVPAGSFLSGAGTGALVPRTPAQVLADISGAPIASPAFTGKPTVPLAPLGVKDNQAANTDFVLTAISTAISELVNTAPGALDTLGEIAAAMGNDPNFAATMVNALAQKADVGRQIIAGNGLSGGGTLGANRTLALGTPGKLTAASTNAVQTTSHTHELDTQTVANDATPGRILTVGNAFGIGADNLLGTAHLDTMTVPGKYGQSQNANATPERNYPVRLAGTLEVGSAGPSITTQAYTVYMTGETYTRGCYNQVWSEWRYAHTDKSLPLATVAQAQAGTDNTAYMTALRTANAIAALATGRIVAVKTMTSSGTYTPTPGTRYARFRGVAPGGGSGGTLGTAANQAAASGAGSAGNHFDFFVMQGLTSMPVTIGAPGAAGTAAPTNGGDGGDIVIGSLATIKGGRGGLAGNAHATFPGLGGACQSNSPSTINALGTFGVLNGLGQTGIRGIVLGITNLVYSTGGNSAWGRGGTLDGGAGIGGGAVGAGVGQNIAASAGFVGGPGILVIEEYA